MRNPVAAVIIASLAVVALSSGVMAQDQEAAPRPDGRCSLVTLRRAFPRCPMPPALLQSRI
jgi:hypothetical protein